MILGDVCTRGCRFCAVSRGNPGGSVDAAESTRIAEAVEMLKLDFAVLTSVTRDDLPDGGASVFADCVSKIHGLKSSPLVELLIPDYTDDILDIVLAAKPEVLAHNIEVVETLSPSYRHEKFSYANSLKVLKQAGVNKDITLTKSSLMLGLGETDAQIDSALEDLIKVNVDILVVGQYLQPTAKHAEVKEYVPPERFDEIAKRATRMGFAHVSAGPLVRTSYKAAEAFAKRRFRPE